MKEIRTNELGGVSERLEGLDRDGREVYVALSDDRTLWRLACHVCGSSDFYFQEGERWWVITCVHGCQSKLYIPLSIPVSGLD